jgi:hypothetical protein
MCDVPPFCTVQKTLLIQHQKGGGVETGRNRSRDWMCGALKIGLKKMKTGKKIKTTVLIFFSCLNFLQLSFS